MVKRPVDFGKFEFSVLSGLRAAQLSRGCSPRLAGPHSVSVMAQMEVAERKVCRTLPSSAEPILAE